MRIKHIEDNIKKLGLEDYPTDYPSLTIFFILLNMLLFVLHKLPYASRLESVKKLTFQLVGEYIFYYKEARFKDKKQAKLFGNFTFALNGQVREEQTDLHLAFTWERFYRLFSVFRSKE